VTSVKLVSLYAQQPETKLSKARSLLEHGRVCERISATWGEEPGLGLNERKSRPWKSGDGLNLWESGFTVGEDWLRGSKPCALQI